MTIFELEQAAQQAAEMRLADATAMLFYDEFADEPGPGRPEWSEISAPFCGCDTCIVREVIDAAWPYLKQLALMAEQADAPDSNSGPSGGAGSTPAEGT